MGDPGTAEAACAVDLSALGGAGDAQLSEAQDSVHPHADGDTTQN